MNRFESVASRLAFASRAASRNASMVSPHAGGASPARDSRVAADAHPDAGAADVAAESLEREIFGRVAARTARRMARRARRGWRARNGRWRVPVWGAEADGSASASSGSGRDRRAACSGVTRAGGETRRATGVATGVERASTLCMVACVIAAAASSRVSKVPTVSPSTRAIYRPEGNLEMPPAGEARGDPRRSAVGGVEAAAATALPRRGVDRVLGGISNPSTQKPKRGVLWGEDGDGATARSKKRTPATKCERAGGRDDDDGNPCVSNFPRSSS